MSGTSAASEGDRDNPPGAGAAPGRTEDQPRARSRRGGRGGRSAGFYTNLNQIPAISAPTSGERASETRAGPQISPRGDFSNAARSLSARDAATPSSEDSEAAQNRTSASGGAVEPLDADADEPPESDSDLGALLAAITEEVQDAAAAARAAIMADYGARIAYARKYLRGHARSAALGALKEGRTAALALVSRNAAQELAGRRQAAIASRSRRPRAGKGGRKPRHNAPHRH
jgi:hypothetical protein